MRKIVLLGDIVDVAAAEVKLRVLQGLERNGLEFVSCPVNNFALDNATFLCRLLCDSMEEGDIQLIVLDPRVESLPRQSIAIELKSGAVIIGPNNGVMSWAARDFGVTKAVLIEDNQDSLRFPTFNGKYKFAPAANSLLKGGKFDDLGVTFDMSEFHDSKPVDGQVIHIDNYGNLKIMGKRMKKTVGDRIEVKFKNKTYKAIFGEQFDDVSVGDLIVYVGSSLHGLPELAVNKGSAAVRLDVRVGDILSINKAS